MSLRKSAVSGIKWSSLSQFGRQAMQFATTAVLARLLAPADFGLVGMATIVTGFIALFKDLGTSAAIIQRSDITESLLSSIFWLNVAFGLMATVVLYLIAPLVAIFYHQPQVAPLLRLLSLTFFIAGLSILHQTLFERALAFNTVAVIELIATLIGAIVGITTAMKGAGAWSLAYQSIAVTLSTTVLLWGTNYWKPTEFLRWTEIKAVSRYSLNLSGYNIFNYLARNMDNLLIGKYLGAESLGYYALAYRIMFYPLQSISAVIGRVMFPLYSRIQHDNDRLSEIYCKVAGAIAFLTFPLMAGLWVLVDPFIETVFGHQWQPMKIMLIILIPVGLLQSIGSTVGVIYQAKGRTDWMLRWGIISGLLVILSFIIGLKWGVIGVATAYATMSIILAYPNFSIPFRLIGLRIPQLGKVLLFPFLCSLLMASCLWVFRSTFPIAIKSGISLSFWVSLGIIIYLLLWWIMDRKQIHYYLETAKFSRE